MADKKRRKRRQVIQTEQYNIKTLHEDREYGLFWYAWIWKIVRPVLIFLCSVLIVIGIVNYGYNQIYSNLLGPVDAQNAGLVQFDIESGQSVTSIGSSLEKQNLIQIPKIKCVLLFLIKYMVLIVKVLINRFCNQ